LARVKEKAIGQCNNHLQPGQLLVKLVKDELTELMGEMLLELTQEHHL
jgi:signal recognition particle GTPase